MILFILLIFTILKPTSSFLGQSLTVFRPELYNYPCCTCRGRIAYVPARANDVEDDIFPLESNEVFNAFLQEVESSTNRETFISVALTKPKASQIPKQDFGSELRSITGRLVSLKAGLRCQLTYKYTTNEQVKNYELGPTTRKEVSGVILRHAFKRATLLTTSKKFDLTANHVAGTARMVEVDEDSSQLQPQALSHDRTKTRPVDPKAAFLRALKVTNDGGRPLIGMADKLRQIERFVEILSGLVDSCPELAARKTMSAPNPYLPPAAPPALKIVDMGCGLAYLTFAVHSHFRSHYSAAVQTLGVEGRLALVSQSTLTAQGLGADFDGLAFEQGSIDQYFAPDTHNGVDSVTSRTTADISAMLGRVNDLASSPRRASMRPDVLIALHACDVATDQAIFSGISNGAGVIVVSPCCHKEIRQQVDRAVAACDVGIGEGTSALLEHGIFRERTAEMVTDALRALCLDHAGYDTKILEFVGGQHTAKNVMIAAIKRSDAIDHHNEAEADRRAVLQTKIRHLLVSYGLQTQNLCALLGLVAPVATPAASRASGTGSKKSAVKSLRKMR